MTRHIYEISVAGSFGPGMREAFADMEVKVQPTITVLSGDLDQPGLHALLDLRACAGPGTRGYQASLRLTATRGIPACDDGSSADSVGQTAEPDKLKAERLDPVERDVKA